VVLRGTGEGGLRWGAQMGEAGMMVVVISPSSSGRGRERGREWQVVQGHVVRNIWGYLRERKEGGGEGEEEGGRGGGVSERAMFGVSRTGDLIQRKCFKGHSRNPAHKFQLRGVFPLAGGVQDVQAGFITITFFNTGKG
jgi:hypothetical protein